MEIRFSKREDPLHLLNKVLAATRQCGVSAQRMLIRDRAVRFILADDTFGTQTATVEQHDQVIRALLTLDPDATVRTARAIYEGLSDFEAQHKARVK